MTSFSIFSLDQSKYHTIDSRLVEFLKGWKLVENYKNQIVTIPGTWNSAIFATKYFSVIKEPSSPNYKPNGEEDEIGLTIECGWPGYDTECIINLFITGYKVKTGTFANIGAEIFKTGGADMKLYWNDKLITDFTKKGWFSTIKIDKVWIDDMRRYL